ncbi:MAG: sulfurtransferase TusA family protein [Synergistaceae bacterium]|nr:sulfurtransferase TusA family protein [Synergistaceae bacterium]
MKTLDACGVSCPEPLLMLKNAFQTESEITILVDNVSALENCKRYARSRGFSISSTTGIDKYEIHIRAAK